ncbi:GH92 family glycosyl hydrolase [uncultured Hymenobacter sp.]|uniref:GH92 family glycosyl hydrolase n=1 Tax=uncultured Hymenobacter sp. TaxID=170016 RepID=UPI0035CC2153
MPYTLSLPLGGFTSWLTHWLLTACFSLLGLTLQAQAPGKEIPISYVNPLVGTAVSTTESARRHSEAGSELKGQTFPAVGVPHGHTHWTPQTRATENKCVSPYYFEDQKIQGFRGSHWMSGSCTQDYGSVTIMPLTGQLKIGATERASAFNRATERATPAHYAVTLADYNIQAEVTATARAGLLQFVFPATPEAYVVVEPNSDEGEGYVTINPAQREISGYNPVHRIYQGRGQSAGFSGYFVAVFDQPFSKYGTWNGAQLSRASQRAQGQKSPVGAFVRFNAAKGLTTHVRVGHSFTSLEEARKNLAAEIPGWKLAKTRSGSEKSWNETLGKVQVSGGTSPEKVKFYTALYHANLLPRLFSDADGSYPGFADDNHIYKAEGFDYYDDFSMWDSYRAVHPLLTLLAPQKTEHMVQSLVKKAEQGGWLPIFPAWNSYTAAMIGDHATAMIGDALMKNLAGAVAEPAYRVMRKNAFEANPNLADYREGKGRRGMASYLRYGYVPLEDSVPDAFHKKEQVSRTLEYAYDDFVLAQVARKLGKQSDYETLLQRARNYRHVFDPAVGYVRGRYADGRWISPFNPLASRVSFITEGSPFQYTWYVPQDVAGLMKLMGGEKRFLGRLDTLFDKGYYWHGNEPNHQIAYLYPYAGAPWKTQARVRTIIREEYGADPGGLSGNEDAGQMSAWLVFSMLGFYPVCPGMPYYVLGSPSFGEVALSMPGSKVFTIRAEGNSAANAYIQSAQLNGKSFTRTYLQHQEILAGGELTLRMGPQPNSTWGSLQADAPPSLGQGVK